MKEENQTVTKALFEIIIYTKPEIIDRSKRKD